MKKLLLLAILLAGCAALKAPRTQPVETTPTPVIITQPAQPEVKEPAVIVKPTQPVVTPVEVNVPVTAKTTRYILDYPSNYAKYVARADKFYQLALTDSSVINRDKFDFSDATAESLKASIRKGFEVHITTYRPSVWKGGKWSAVIGYHSAGTIFLNTYFIDRPDCEIINTLVHEASHNMGYSHGTNSPDGKDNSVPYWIGDRAQELCEQGKI